MRWLGYAWTVAVNCFYLFVVLWAFDKIENRHELTITVAILGLIYVAIRTSSMYQFTAMLEIFSQTKKQLLQLQKFVRDPQYEANQREWDETEEIKQKSRVKFWINAFFLWVIGLWCTLVLLMKLGNLPKPY